MSPGSSRLAVLSQALQIYLSSSKREHNFARRDASSARLVHISVEFLEFPAASEFYIGGGKLRDAVADLKLMNLLPCARFADALAPNDMHMEALAGEQGLTLRRPSVLRSILTIDQYCAWVYTWKNTLSGGVAKLFCCLCRFES